jgi:hypothetical protein
MNKTILILLGTLISSCATPAQQHHFVKTSQTSLNYEKTWERVIEFFANNNIPIKNVAKDSGIIVAETLSFTSDYADCGKPGIDQPVSDVGTFNVFVKQADKVSLTVNAIFDENRISGWDGHHYKAKCFSTGKIEKEIIDYVGL